MRMLFSILAGSSLTSILGTTSDPISAGSTLSKGPTWVLPESRPYSSSLKVFKVYCTAGGTLKLKVLSATSGGFNVTEVQTLTCAIGLNSFTVAGGTLNSATIPANGLLAFVTPASGGATVSYLSDSSAYSAGYLSAPAEITGSNQILTSASYQHQIQVQFTTTFTRSAGSYFINEDCSGSVLPAYAINNATNPWTFLAGKLTNASTGLASFLDFYPTTNANGITLAVEFEFTSGSDRFCIYRKPILTDAGALTGTIGEADLANNRIIIYQSWQGGTTYALPSIQSTLTLTGLTLSVGVKYRLELIKSGRLISLRITDTTTNDTETLSVDNETKVSGLGYGRPGFASLAGTVDVRDVKFYASNTNPSFVILGDSVTEGSAATDKDTEGFAALSLVSGSGWYDGDGGTLLSNIIKRLRNNLRLCAPRFVIIESLNNASSDANVTAYQTQIVDIYNACVNAGLTPIVCTLTPNSDGTQNTRNGTLNTFLLAQGWNISRFDLAISTNNDGTTYNAALMGDGIHPNTAGHALLYSKLKSDFPQLGT